MQFQKPHQQQKNKKKKTNNKQQKEIKIYKVKQNCQGLKNYIEEQHATNFQNSPVDFMVLISSHRTHTSHVKFLHACMYTCNYVVTHVQKMIQQLLSSTF